MNLTSLRALLAQATPGPWHVSVLSTTNGMEEEWGVYTRDSRIAFVESSRSDADLLVVALNAIEPLLRRLDRAEAVVQLVERDHDHFHSMPWEKCQSRTCEAARACAEGEG